MKKLLLPCLSLLFVFIACNLNAILPEDSSDCNLSNNATTARSAASLFQKYEAESASYGSLPAEQNNSTSNISLRGQYDGNITFTIESPSSTEATLVIRTYGIGSYKENYLSVNGEYQGIFTSENESWTDSWNAPISLKAGSNTITLNPYWGWTKIDYIELINPNPSDSTSASSESSNPVFAKYDAGNSSYGSLPYEDSSVSLRGQYDGNITFTVSSSAATEAKLIIHSYGIGSYKENYLSVNGEYQGIFTSENESWTDSWNAAISLKAGTNTITLNPYWGWTKIDYIEIINTNSSGASTDTSAGTDTGSNSNSDSSTSSGSDATDTSNTSYNFVSTLCDSNANDAAKNLMAEIAANYGKKIITGQMDLTWYDNIDMAQRVHNDTGYYPKLMGYDFMEYLESYYGNGRNQTQEAIAWHNAGGYVQFCWHWKITGPDGNHNFYSNHNGGTNFTIPYSNGQWDTSSDYYKQLINDMDKIAEELKTLQSAGVPVLWRPLHEGAGNVENYNGGTAWFWWGNSGAEAYKALYKLMFDRFTNYHELHNLIWVWNGQAKSYYPGDAYVDIIGQDVYPDRWDYSSQKSKFDQGVNFGDNPSTAPKMVALTENGSIPSPANCYADNAMWAWFMTWNDGNTAEGVWDYSNYWTGECYNSNAHKIEVYSSDLTIKR